jgi:hypothetical protein
MVLMIVTLGLRMYGHQVILLVLYSGCTWHKAGAGEWAAHHPGGLCP